MPRGLAEGRQVVAQLGDLERGAGPDEPLLAQRPQHVVVVPREQRRDEPAERARQAAGQLEAGAEVEHPEPAVVQQPEVARVRVGVQQTAPGRAAQQEPLVELAEAVPLRLCPVRRDPGQRYAVQPALHQHAGGGVHDARDDGLAVVAVPVGVRRGEPPLVGRLAPVVELLEQAGAQLGDEWRHRHATRDERCGPGRDREGPDVGEDRLADARVLDLDRDVRRGLAPDRPVDLADRRRRRRLFVELLEEIAPLWAELATAARLPCRSTASPGWTPAATSAPRASSARGPPGRAPPRSTAAGRP